MLVAQKGTQAYWVLEAMLCGVSLSSKDAVTKYGVQDLPKRISELRQLGVPVESVRVDGHNRFAQRTHWNIYLIPSKERDRYLFVDEGIAEKEEEDELR